MELNHLKKFEIKRQRLAQPANALGMIFEIVSSLLVDERREVSAIYFEPLNYLRKRRIVKMGFNHSGRMWPYWFLVKVD